LLLELPDDGYTYTCGYKYEYDCTNVATKMLDIRTYNSLRHKFRYSAICNYHKDELDEN